MEGDSFWEDVENASAANIELGGILRQLGGLHQGSSPFDWQESWGRRSEILWSCFGDPERDSRLAEIFDGKEYEIGGDEHHLIRFDEDPSQIFKVTHSDSFGCYAWHSPADPERTGRHFFGSVNENPAAYIRRWTLLNALGEYQTQFVGLLQPAERGRLPRICMSQPYVDAPLPELETIKQGMASIEFQEISRDTFLRTDDRILLSDAAPRNVREVEGVLVLFDVVAQIASDPVLEWGKNRS